MAGSQWARPFGRAVLAGVRLVLPVECPGCGRPDVRLCDQCAQVLAGRPFRCDDDAPALARSLGRWPVWAIATYVAPVRPVILAWKDHGRGDLTPTLAAALSRCAAELSPQFTERASTMSNRPEGARVPLTVVPMPSSPAARRRRGECLVTSLADAVAAELADHFDAQVVSAFGLRTAGRQVTLDRRARLAHRQRELVPVGPRPFGPVLLIDDIVTTGATLATAAAMLEDAPGSPVIGGLVLAATPSPRS